MQLLVGPAVACGRYELPVLRERSLHLSSIFEASLEVPRELMDSFRQVFQKNSPRQWEEDKQLGFDGISVRADYLEAKPFFQCSNQVWSPTRKRCRVFASYVRALLEMGRNLFSEARARDALGACYSSLVGSLNAGFTSPNSMNYVGASPHLVLNGNVSKHRQEEFRQLLAQIRPEAPLLVEVARPDLGIVDDQLLPELKQLEERSGLTAWFSTSAKDERFVELCRACAVDSNRIFSSSREAVRRLRRESSFQPAFDAFLLDAVAWKRGGNPTWNHLVFHGEVVSTYQKKLHRLLTRVPSGVPLLLEARNPWLGVMDDALFPWFLRCLERRPGKHVWWVNESETKRLKEMNVKEEFLFTSYRKATQALSLR